MPRSGLRAAASPLRPSPASMRPGQSCPGVAVGRAALAAARPCFNEAGAIMPRSGGHRLARQRDRHACFNEAGAIMPRSGVLRPSLTPRAVTCFNEAGAIMPRSGQGQEHRGEQLLLASMRPGQSCPGVGRSLPRR